MKADDVPRCFRESPLLAQAFQDGQAAGRAGVAAEQNPWVEKGPGHDCGLGRGRDHALLKVGGRRAMCGTPAYTTTTVRFDPTHAWSCKRCIRAVEAEQRRLETRWEQGRLSTHPK